MIEHSIRLWNRFDGSWDVTHHKSDNRRGDNLYDVEKDFKNFKEIREAIDYMITLKKKFKAKHHLVEKLRFESFGYQNKEGNWSAVPLNEKQLSSDKIEKILTKMVKP